MEDLSHELIDKLNAEEKYCYGFDSQPLSQNIVPANNQEKRPHAPTTNKKEKQGETTTSKEETSDKSPIITSTTKDPSIIDKTVKEVQKTKKVRSSTTQVPATHNQRWSAEEDALLEEAIEKFGYGHWTETAAHVKTRNSLQCKNRGRQKYVNSQQKKTPKPKMKRDNNNIDDHPACASTSNESLPTANKVPITPPSDDLNINKFESASRSTLKSLLPAFQSSAPNEMDAASAIDTTESHQSEGHEIEVEVDPNDVSADERIQNSEWFVPGRTAKTPERYMRIRNHIISCWKNSKPSYLTKTAGRKNLPDCGDVNAVGRIHAYLESIHAINVNCTSPVKRVYGRRASSANQFDEDGMPVKKKAKKTPGYFWADVDSDKEGGHDTRDSLIIKGDGKSRPRRAVKRLETFYNEDGHDFGQGNDPFTLVPVGYYTNDRSAPFTVDITSNALLVMDFHAHLAYTEIIGLLGGRVVDKGDGIQQLKVEYVFPCRSTSTGIQCEMDPVSEMEAREVFEQKGLRVVGWYHSHPTFEPEPSIRDIENQTSYQDLFRDEKSGIEPFIGVIITPYNSRNMVPDKSQFQFIHISKRWSLNGAYRLPFACYQKVTQCKAIPQDISEIFENLIDEYKTYEHKIDMKLQYGQVSRLEKLMRSLKNHLFMDPEENNDKFLSDLRGMMIEKSFVDGEATKEEKRKNEKMMQTQESSQQMHMDHIVNSLSI